jgi:hypothetical protein
MICENPRFYDFALRYQSLLQRLATSEHEVSCHVIIIISRDLTCVNRCTPMQTHGELTMKLRYVPTYFFCYLIAAWFKAVQTLMSFAMAFEFIALAMFPLSYEDVNNVRNLTITCVVTGLISKSVTSLM